MCDLRMSLQREAEQERLRDIMYRVLVTTPCLECGQLAKGVTRLVQGRSQHPAIVDVAARMDDVLVQRAVILAALVHEPDFLQHVLDIPGVCRSTMSEYALRVLPELIEKFICGDVVLPDFVLGAAHAYVSL